MENKKLSSLLAQANMMRFNLLAVKGENHNSVYA
jgi:hypothetical protein